MFHFIRKPRSIDSAMVGRSLARLLILVLVFTSVAGPTSRTAQAAPPAASAAPLPDAPALAYPSLPATAPTGSIYNSALAQADAPREVGRSAFSRTELNPDGTYKTAFYQRPIHFRAPTGEWRPFDNRLRAAPAGSGWTHENAQGPFRVRFDRPADVAAGRPVMSFSAEGVTATMTALGANPSGATVSGNEIVYANAYQDASLRYVVDGERAKEEIVLRSAPANAAAASFASEIEIDGATAQKRADGSIGFSKPSGDLAFEIPRPFMVDGSGDAELGTTDAVAVTLTELSAGKYRLEYSADLAWLRDPARVYPVVLDPSFSTFTAAFRPDGTDPNGTSQDVSIAQCCPSSNYEGRDGISVGKNTTYGNRSVALLQFTELRQLPADTGIIDANVYLHSDPDPTYVDGMSVGVHRVTKDWQASTVSWSTRPTYDATPRITVKVARGARVQLGLPDLVRKWVREEYANQGIWLEPGGANGEYVRFRSSEYADPVQRPSLEVLYVRASRYGVSGLWNYTSREYGGGNASHVNTSTGNLVFTHSGGSVGARGFSVDLTHTYNAQDPHYASSPFKGADFGEGWSFSQGARLYEVAKNANGEGTAVILKDGSGGANRTYIAKSPVVNGVRHYFRPLYYGATLTRDLSSTADPKRIFTLAPDKGGAKMYFDGGGKLRRIEDRHCKPASDPDYKAGDCNFLEYEYDTDATNLADPAGKLVRIRDVAGRLTTLTYNGAGGRLSRIVDMAGRPHDYGYDAEGNLTTIAHAPGTADEARTRFGYDGAHQMVSVTDPLGSTSYLRYRVEESWEDAAAGTHGWGSDDPATTPGVARATQQHYDVGGQPAGAASLQVDLQGVSATQRGSVSRALSPVESWNAVPQEVIVWAYVDAESADVEGQLTAGHRYGATDVSAWTPLPAKAWTAIRIPNAQIDAAWEVRSLRVQLKVKDSSPNTYSGKVYLDGLAAKGIAESLTDAERAPGTTANTVARFAYRFALNTPSAEVFRPNTLGGETQFGFTHNRAGQVTEVRTPAGDTVSRTSAKYDDFLRLQSVSLPDGGGSYSYGYAGTAGSETSFVQSATNPLGEQSYRGVEGTTGDATYGLDPLNQQRRTAGSVFQASVVKRDGTGNVLETETREYQPGTNIEDQTTRETGGTALRGTKFTYGLGGLVTGMTPPECARRADTTPCRTTFGYDTPKGHLLRITAPAGDGETSARVTKFTKDAAGTLGRNADGSPIRVVDAKGQTTLYGYDALGRLERIEYLGTDGQADRVVTYDLDAAGNMTGMVEKELADAATGTYRTAGSTAWAYDENNQLARESRTEGGATKTAAYAYEPNGLMRATTTAAGQTVSYEYDASLRLRFQTDPNDPSAGDRKIGYAYDARGRRTAIVFPSGVRRDVSFDRAGRVSRLALTNQNATELQSFAYDYGFDAAGARTAAYRNGNVVGVVEKTAGLLDSAITYRYDAFDRLAEAERTGQSPYRYWYGYDANNNRTSLRYGTTTLAAAYDDANQLLAYNGQTYGYDRNGNMTRYGPSTNPTANTLEYDAANQWTGGRVAGYDVAMAYDGLGRRTGRSLGAAQTEYWYDATGLSLETGAEQGTYLRDPGGALLSAVTSTGFANYAADRLGNVTATTNAGGNLVSTYRYQPFGGLLDSTGSGRNPYRFTGTYLDGATGLYQMGARYYQPTTGRFTQQDPLGSSVFTANRYAYVSCNPTNATDPTGLVESYGEGGLTYQEPGATVGNCGRATISLTPVGGGRAIAFVALESFWGNILYLNAGITWFSSAGDGRGSIVPAPIPSSGNPVIVPTSLYTDSNIIEPGTGSVIATLSGFAVTDQGICYIEDTTYETFVP